MSETPLRFSYEMGAVVDDYRPPVDREGLLRVSDAAENRKRYASKYTGERGDMLAVGTRVRVRPDVLTARSKSVRAWYVDTGVVARLCPRLLGDGTAVYEYPYMVLMDDGIEMGGYAGWELETVVDTEPPAWDADESIPF